MAKLSKEEKKAISNEINKLVRFPGSLADYNSFKNGIEHEIMNTGQTFKGVFVDNNNSDETYILLGELMKKGCTGFINYVPVQETYIKYIGGYGIPVKPKF